MSYKPLFLSFSPQKSLMMIIYGIIILCVVLPKSQPSFLFINNTIVTKTAAVTLEDPDIFPLPFSFSIRTILERTFTIITNQFRRTKYLLLKPNNQVTESGFDGKNSHFQISSTVQITNSRLMQKQCRDNIYVWDVGPGVGGRICVRFWFCDVDFLFFWYLPKLYANRRHQIHIVPKTNLSLAFAFFPS